MNCCHCPIGFCSSLHSPGRAPRSRAHSHRPLRAAPMTWVPFGGKTSSIWEHTFTPLHLGIILAVSGNLLIACSLALQKWVHMAFEREDEEPRLAARARTLFPVALLGLMLGEVGNFAAFGLASPTVVSPLGAVAVIANAAIAFLVLKARPVPPVADQLVRQC